VETFNQWWQAVSKTADIMGFLNLSMPIINRDGNTRTLNWWQNGESSDSNDVLKVSLPVQDRRAGPKLSLNIEVCGNNCLESAGRRVALFTRLMDEYDITILSEKGNTRHSEH